jgi:tripartite-type tricarboxylate transporter receptor subunit TctC
MPMISCEPDPDERSAGVAGAQSMKLPRRRFLHLAAGATALPAVSRIASAQTYPSRPITIVVPAAAGGPLDVLARILSERMRLSLAQPLLIENVAGAAGSIGVGRVARATPDGYTLSMGMWGTHVVNPAIYALSYDVVRDFEPILLIGSMPELIVAKKATPAKDLKGLIAWLKANPDKASQGTSGVGSAGHVAGVFFQNVTGTRYQFVPYRGLAPAMAALLAGQIDMMIDVPTSSLPHVRSGSIKAYAIMNKGRIASAPDIPTVDEAGLPGFYASVWYSLWAPKRTPMDIISKLNAAAMDALDEPVVRARLAEIGQEIFPREQQTPEALGALQRAEIEKWWQIIKAANIKGE